MNHSELAWGLAEVFDDLPIEEINEVLAKNVPFETLQFFSAYADSMAATMRLDAEGTRRLPNLLIVGYLLRLLEDRLLEEAG